jgi:hypothetical protein
MSNLLAAMSHGTRPLALLICLVSLWVGLGTAQAATWQEHRDAGFLAFANADYAASAEHLERALARAEQGQASARERGVIFERLTTAYLATRWFRRARTAISRWDRILADSRGETWAYEQRSVRDGLAALVTEVIGKAAPEAATMSSESTGEMPAAAGEGSDFEAVVDVPFAPDAPLPVTLAADPSYAAASEPASAVQATPAAGGYGLHLVSLTDQEAVAGSWATLQESYPEILAGKDLAVRQVDLGDKGIFFRLHAAAFAGSEMAQATCEKLRSLDQYCAVVDLD